MNSHFRNAGRFFLSILLIAGWSRSVGDASSSLRKVPAVPAATEERWMVESIVRETVRMAAVASGRGPSLLRGNPFSLQEKHEGSYVVDLRLPGRALVRSRISMAEGVWDPHAYAGLAGELLAALGASPEVRPAVAEGALLNRLTNPRVEGLLYENARISRWLTSEPMDPRAHEQAALLLGTLGLRENAGCFSDARPVCNRLTAHLAFAEALRGGRPSSLCGQTAAMVGDLLAESGERCERKVKALCAAAVDCPELRPWLLIARFRERRDWRVADGRLPASLLERMEFFRALCASAGTEAGCTALARRPFEDLPEWPRILLGSDYTTAEAKGFVPFALSFELEEIRRVFPQLAGVPAQTPAFSSVLNQLSTGAVIGSKGSGFSMRVIDDGLWAQYLQRHLCHALCQTERYQREFRGQRDEAKAFTRAATAIFGRLQLFPLAAVMSGESAWAETEGPAAARLLREHPEQIMAAVWSRFQKQPAAGREHALPILARWYSPALPAGTAYDFAARAEAVPSLRRASRGELEELHRVAPWDFGVAERLAVAVSAGRPSNLQFQELVGPFMRFYRTAWQRYPEMVRDNPEVYIASLRQMADLNPELYATLGGYLARHGRPEAAAEAYASLLDRRVSVAALTEAASWLATYYLDRQQPVEALAAAHFAETGGVPTGLQAVAQLRERMNDLSAAEALYQRMEDVYEDPAPLLRFYERNVAREPRYGALLTAEMARIFPIGIIPSLGEEALPPVRGVSVVRGGAPIEAAGLQPKDVVVAVNGRQAASREQYAYLRGEGQTSPLHLVVYREGGYRAVHVPGAALPLSVLATWHQ